MGKHTAGPWELQQYTNHFGFSIWAKDRGCIAERWYDTQQQPPYDDEIYNNALLISAAPDLLEACRAAFKMLQDMTSDQYARGDDRKVRLQLAAAIQKSEGQ